MGFLLFLLLRHGVTGWFVSVLSYWDFTQPEWQANCCKMRLEVNCDTAGYRCRLYHSDMEAKTNG